MKLSHDFPLLKPHQNLMKGLCVSLLMMLFSGCLTSQKEAEKKIARLEKASQEHNQMLDQQLGSTDVFQQKPKKKSTQSSVTLNEGDTSPAWVLELPAECDSELYCGLAFVDFCENAHSCREEAETKARDDLRKRISVRIQSQTSSRAYSDLSASGENAHKTFESEIRERGISIELKDVRFSHFYLKPDKQLQTLARMKRPEEQEPEIKDETEPVEKAVAEFPPLLLAFTDDEKNPELNHTESWNLFQQRLIATLKAEDASLLEKAEFQFWESLRGNALQEKAAEALAEFPKSYVVVLSLSGRMDPFKGRMFKGMTTVFLNVAAYGEEGMPLFRKSYKARRFMPKPPGKLETEQKQDLFLRTVEKGLNEFEEQQIMDLKKALSAHSG